jgi:hypothetical protein
MSKAQRYKQQQKDAKAAAAAKAAKGPSISEPYVQKTLRERTADSKAQLAKHQQSMDRLKLLEDKLAAAKTAPAAGVKDEVKPADAPGGQAVKHETNTAIKATV